MCSQGFTSFVSLLWVLAPGRRAVLSMDMLREVNITCVKCVECTRCVNTCGIPRKESTFMLIDFFPHRFSEDYLSSLGKTVGK